MGKGIAQASLEWARFRQRAVAMFCGEVTSSWPQYIYPALKETLFWFLFQILRSHTLIPSPTHMPHHCFCTHMPCLDSRIPLSWHSQMTLGNNLFPRYSRSYSLLAYVFLSDTRQRFPSISYSARSLSLSKHCFRIMSVRKRYLGR